ncbi:glycosyl transferase group 1 [Peptoclostridium acidaminophilum DSM 3953]|uniref:Glycosyl transferase group 1 n=1 Tax=Peptoclostridium acidaminophilum DSM 3953 TaxID=1286171 RepID=W8U8H8_PEPAC|nr:glycosyltransferase family 4 protein [Peptoclostridium acidaminophilum]AHM57161.1 glycosyl transferase group 1 [Peptoclostridium acidaminophilum DSM 3953]
MKIVIVNDYADIKGVSSAVAIESARALAQAGESVIFFCAAGPIDEKLIHKNITVISMDQKDIIENSYENSRLWNRKAYVSLGRLLGSLDKNNTVVHFHSFVNILSSAALRVVKDRGFKCVLTLHDYFTACPNGNFYDCRNESCCELEGLSAACIRSNCEKRGYMHKLWLCSRQAIQMKKGRVPAGVDAFISISEYSERILRPYLSESARIYRVKNPVNIQNEGPERVAESKVFTFLDRLGAENGAGIFAQAASLAGVEATFIGDGPMRKQLEEILPGALFSGRLRPENEIRLLRESRAIVFPTLLNEMHALAVLKAKALGIPSIVSSGSSAEEFVESGEDGFIFERGSIDDLVQKLKIMGSDSLVRRMGREAHRRYWEASWTPENHAIELMEVYNDVLGGI